MIRLNGEDASESGENRCGGAGNMPSELNSVLGSILGGKCSVDVISMGDSGCDGLLQEMIPDWLSDEIKESQEKQREIEKIRNRLPLWIMEDIGNPIFMYYLPCDKFDEIKTVVEFNERICELDRAVGEINSDAEILRKILNSEMIDFEELSSDFQKSLNCFMKDLMKIFHMKVDDFFAETKSDDNDAMHKTELIEKVLREINDDHRVWILKQLVFGECELDFVSEEISKYRSFLKMSFENTFSERINEISVAIKSIQGELEKIFGAHPELIDVEERPCIKLTEAELFQAVTEFDAKRESE